LTVPDAASRRAHLWACELSEEYVRITARYTT